MKARRAVFVGVALAGLALFLAGPTIQPAGAASIRWLAVQLGVHQFGHLRAPDAIVAHTHTCISGDTANDPHEAH